MLHFKLYFICFVVFCVYGEVTAVHEYIGPSPCETNSDCDHLEDAACIDGMCECEGSKICKQALGTKVTKVGQKCKLQDDCNIENSECDFNRCVCKSGYTYNNKGTKCLKIAEGLDDKCEDSVQCYTKVENSGCQENKCVCQQHMHAYKGSCYTNVELGGSCTHHGFCSNTHFAECINLQCTCSENYVKVPTSVSPICLPIGEQLNDTCVDDIQCTTTLGMGSGCIDGFCKCKEIYQFKKSINKCVKDMMLNDNCETHRDCRDPLEKENRLECIMGVCKCRSFYKEMDGHCLNVGHQYQAVSTTLVFIFVIFLSINFL